MVRKNWFMTKGSSVDQFLISLPVPSNITNWWSNGSLLGVVYMNQVITGLFMASYYIGGVEGSFDSVIYIESEVWYGWMWRSLHFNGASLFFIIVYFHVGRGFYFGSFRKTQVWLSGSVMLFVLMAIAFLGYVLPWGQMSYWGATVITNLLSTVPLVGEELVGWVWGGFSVSGVTITRFYMIHFLLPLVLGVLIGGHLVVLHETGSSNPVGVSSADKIPFSPYFSWKDSVWFVIWVGGLVVWSMELPWLLGEADNFEEANSLVTPDHIKPEWYFLFAYGVLRSVPSKAGGVVALVMSIGIVPLSVLVSRPLSGCHMSIVKKSMFWSWVWVWVVLSWAGGKPVEPPYSEIGLWSGLTYFLGWCCVVM